MKMSNEVATTLEQPEVSYLRNALATGIANYIVAKISKATEISVDKQEIQRYPPNTT